MHVYGQYIYHSPATIRGNRLALEGLRAAIDEALKSGKGEASVCATDGEGYGIDVVHTEMASGVGRPEYQYLLEFEMGKREAQRVSELRLAAPSQSQ